MQTWYDYDKGWVCPKQLRPTGNGRSRRKGSIKESNCNRDDASVHFRHQQNFWSFEAFRIDGKQHDHIGVFERFALSCRGDAFCYLARVPEREALYAEAHDFDSLIPLWDG